MKTNRLLLLAVIATTTLCAVLVWSNVVATGRARELKAQLDAKEIELQQLTAGNHSTPRKTVDNGMGELLAQRDAEYDQLREVDDKLKQQLAAAQAAMAAPPPAVTSTPTRVGFSPFSRRNMSNYLERVRQQDPARYAQIVQQIQQRQQQAAQEYDDQMAGLVQRAQAAQTPEEADLVSQITDTLSKINELRQSRAALADLPEDQQQAQVHPINDQLRQAYAQLSDLRNQDRTLQLQNLATQLGLKSQDAQTLVEGVPQIYKNTQYTPQRGPGGGGGFAGEGGGGAAGASTSPSTTTPPQQPSTATK